MRMTATGTTIVAALVAAGTGISLAVATRGPAPSPESAGPASTGPVAVVADREPSPAAAHAPARERAPAPRPAPALPAVPAVPAQAPAPRAGTPEKTPPRPDGTSAPPARQVTIVRTRRDPVAFGPGLDGIAYADDWVDPPGEYREIDVDDLERKLTAINGSDPKARTAAVDAVAAHPEKFAPPALFAIGRALFDDGRKEEGAFWYYAGMLRARFDVARCTDRTVTDVSTVLVQNYGPPISKWTYLDLDAFEKRVARVVAWDEKTPHDYDARWIALHGMGSILARGESGRPLTVPAGQWPDLEKHTREKWAADLAAVVNEVRKRAK